MNSYRDMVAEAPDFTLLKHKVVAGRKEHLCCHCKRAIDAGKRHHVLAYRDNDVSPAKLVQERWHILCDPRIERFDECGNCYGNGCRSCRGQGQVQNPRWRELYEESRL